MTGPKTIVYIGGFELPDRNAAAHRVRGNARILRDLGFRVVLLGVSKRLEGDGSPQLVESGDQGIEGYEVPYPRTKAEWAARTASPKCFEQLLDAAKIENLALVICYNYPAIAQWRIARRARNSGARAAADVTEWYAQEPVRSLASLVKNLDTPLRMRWVNSRMDGLITTSPFITSFYRRTSKPIVEIPTIMSEPVAAPADDARTGLIRLFFAGTGFDPALVPEGREGLKDRLDWVIDILARVPQTVKFRLDIFGADSESYLAIVPEHREVLQQLGEAIVFHGRRPHAEVLSTLCASDFSIFLRNETRVTLAGFPSKFAESITQGTPVITNPMRSLDRYLEDGKNGLTIDPSDLTVAAQRLQTVLEFPPEQIDEMKRYCRRSGLFLHGHYKSDMASWLEQLELL